MKDLLKVAVILGTDRPNNQSQHAANFIVSVGNNIEGIEITLVDPKNIKYSYSEKDPNYTKIVEESDAFFVVTPEYNHTFSGVLKILMDMELPKYNHKAVALAGVSSGPWGGARAIESLVPYVRELGLVVTSEDVNFPNAKSLFDENGKLTDETYTKRVEKAFEELIWMAKTLKWGRENLQ